MNSFQAKTGWKRMGIRENKNYCSVLFLPMRNRKCQKNNEKIQRIKKYQYEYISSQNRLETYEKETNKNYRFVPSLPNA